MQRLLPVAALVALLPFACVSFKDKRTPSGDFCSDMSVVPAGTEVDREYHRLQPIQSDPKARTEAERLESLRKAACNVGADAVIEAVNEEVRGDSSAYTMVSSGTAVIWLRHANADLKPLSLTTKKTADPAPSAAPTADPTASPSASASAAPSAKPGAGKPKTGPKPIGKP
jgi:hypothetical protein